MDRSLLSSSSWTTEMSERLKDFGFVCDDDCESVSDSMGEPKSGHTGAGSSTSNLPSNLVPKDNSS